MTDNDSKEIYGESAQTLSQILIAASAAYVSGGDPYIVGTATFLSQFLNLRKGLKVNRVNNFVDSFTKYITSINREFDVEHVNSESFQDFFEELLIKVSCTSSKAKLVRFRSLLFNEIFITKAPDESLKILEIVDKLDDNQFLLLNTYVHTEIIMEEIRLKLSELAEVREKLKTKENNVFGAAIPLRNIQLEENKRAIEKAKQEYETPILERKKALDSYFLGDIPFNVQYLRGLGLIYNPAEGRVSNTGEVEYFKVTQFSITMINAISENF